jgi:hypothetical protein
LSRYVYEFNPLVDMFWPNLDKGPTHVGAYTLSLSTLPLPIPTLWPSRLWSHGPWGTQQGRPRARSNHYSGKGTLFRPPYPSLLPVLLPFRYEPLLSSSPAPALPQLLSSPRQPPSPLHRRRGQGPPGRLHSAPRTWRVWWTGAWRKRCRGERGRDEREGARRQESISWQRRLHVQHRDGRWP